MSRTRMAVLAAVAVMALAAPVHAMTVGGEVFGAYNSYGMSDWQDAIDQANASGANFNDVTSGFGGGLGLRTWATPSWMLAATWEPLFKTSKDDASSTELKLNGNSYQATAGYFFPMSGPGKFGLGAGVGLYTLNGSISGAGGGDLTGSTVGFHFLGMGEWSVSPGFSLTGSAGYRVAKIDDTKFNDTSSNPKFHTDYSGFMGRVGLAFYMPSSNSK
ncbi:MAG: hypothetical protein E6K80_09705 [Candidatus Eisenbacteria bacterium]|uniref:Uncharacterized protein n=1 Tax=Eiseniibacteriota bacterium TaxID=2212470 RepID=A0A538U2S1_UNCEI|nr:MAG: hypothetical protein E6K80_09705 [Candidatus Eisenbacteria bacterium]